MNMRLSLRGFTLAEVVVVAGIVAVLATIILMNIQGGGQKARDTQRISDLQNVLLAMKSSRVTLGTAAQSAYPSYPSGDLVGDGIGFDAPSDFLPEVVADPKHGQTDFGYYYNSDYDCAGTPSVIITALTMERPSNANWSTECNGTDPIASGITPSSDTYVIVISQ